MIPQSNASATTLAGGGAPSPPGSGSGGTTPSGDTETLESAHASGTRRRAPGPLLAPGRQILGTPYVVIRPLGRGGMGEVYEVEETGTGARCAIKLLAQDLKSRVDLAARMRREAALAARVDHPNVVRVLGEGQSEDGRPYLVMELLRGHDLREVLTRSGVLPVPRALALVAGVLDGLAAVHAAGIVHRDMKLENLHLGEGDAVKILDFGVAKGRRLPPATLPGTAIGTPRTMAPEQCAHREVDPRADLYAAGLALYELVAGRGPFDELRGQPEALRYAHCERTPPPPSTVAPQWIAPAVEAAILKALAKAPEHRFQSAAEMAATLRRLARRLAGSDPGSWVVRARLGPVLVLTLAVLVFVVGVVTGCALGPRVGGGHARPGWAAGGP